MGAHQSLVSGIYDLCNAPIHVIAVSCELGNMYSLHVCTASVHVSQGLGFPGFLWKQHMHGKTLPCAVHTVWQRGDHMLQTSMVGGLPVHMNLSSGALVLPEI